MITLTPSYGRDYNSKKEVEKDFNDNKDFTVNQFMHPYDGKQANKSDLKGAGETSVKIRYKNLERVHVINL